MRHPLAAALRRLKFRKRRKPRKMLCIQPAMPGMFPKIRCKLKLPAICEKWKGLGVTAKRVHKSVTACGNLELKKNRGTKRSIHHSQKLGHSALLQLVAKVYQEMYLTYITLQVSHQATLPRKNIATWCLLFVLLFQMHRLFRATVLVLGRDHWLFEPEFQRNVASSRCA